MIQKLGQKHVHSRAEGIYRKITDILGKSEKSKRHAEREMSKSSLDKSHKDIQFCGLKIKLLALTSNAIPGKNINTAKA